MKNVKNMVINNKENIGDITKADGTIRNIDKDIIQFGSCFCYSEDRYKYGRDYDIITKEEAEKIIEETIEKYKEISVEEYPSIEAIEDRKGYVINGCGHSNGYTTDFFIRVDNIIYMCSYVDTKWHDCYISTAYDIEKDSFITDEKGYAITSKKVYDFIEEYAIRYY